MTVTEHPQALMDRLTSTNPNLTQIRAIAQEVGKSQATADYLWTYGEMIPRLLALLVLDLKTLTPASIDRMIVDIEASAMEDQRQVCDWLIANVIMKKSALKQTANQWRVEPSVLKQRVFWSVQARTLKAIQHEQNECLLEALEVDMATAHPMVQEPMNWCAAQIGIHDETLRTRCIHLGERLALYKDYPVSKGCTSPYLPIWITAVVGKNEAQTSA